MSDYDPEGSALPSPHALPAYGMQPAQLGTDPALPPPAVVEPPPGLVMGADGNEMLPPRKDIKRCVGLLIVFVVLTVAFSIGAVFNTGPGNSPAGFIAGAICCGVGALIVMCVDTLTVVFDTTRRVLEARVSFPLMPCRSDRVVTITFVDLGAMTVKEIVEPELDGPHLIALTVTLAYRQQPEGGPLVLCNVPAQAGAPERDAMLQLRWATYLARLQPGPPGLLPAPVYTAPIC